MNFSLNDKIDKMYYTFKIRKGNGKYREISAPLDELKAAQNKVIEHLSYIKVARDAMGFINDRSIITNARKHLNKPYLLNIDLENFFPTITSDKVFNALIREGVDEKLAKNITTLCTLDGALPQGAPSSPFLSNVVFKPIDKKISKACKSVAYTRYADDITLSGDKKDVLNAKKQVFDIIKFYGFKVNPGKIHGAKQAMRQEVTGVVVNEKTNIKRDDLMRFRAKLHNLKCKILDGEIKTEDDILLKTGEDLNKVRGYASFIYSANRKKGIYYKNKIKEIERMLKS